MRPIKKKTRPKCGNRATIFDHMGYDGCLTVVRQIHWSLGRWSSCRTVPSMFCRCWPICLYELLFLLYDRLWTSCARPGENGVHNFDLSNFSVHETTDIIRGTDIGRSNGSDFICRQRIGGMFVLCWVSAPFGCTLFRDFYDENVPKFPMTPLSQYIWFIWPISQLLVYLGVSTMIHKDTRHLRLRFGHR